MKTYVELLPRELYLELDKYIFFNSIVLEIDENQLAFFDRIISKDAGPTITREYSKKGLEMDIENWTIKNSYVIYSFTSLQSELVMSKFQSLLNDIDNKTLRRFY